MRETYIIAPGLNSNNIVKIKALHNVKCFNLNIVNDVQLAKIALMKQGYAITEQMLDSKEEGAVCHSLRL